MDLFAPATEAEIERLQEADATYARSTAQRGCLRVTITAPVLADTPSARELVECANRQPEPWWH